MQRVNKRVNEGVNENLTPRPAPEIIQFPGQTAEATTDAGSKERTDKGEFEHDFSFECRNYDLRKVEQTKTFAPSAWCSGMGLASQRRKWMQ
jgi:hypothetical protein